ncbi:Pre-rRNA-processing protein ESF2 [Lineolata rhizophorae]|uniref:18S rRNA factor 2 n=1 Tax=Lineolata rhizophorae TaxID=578093 RepID=A0A6A6P5C3_9PEZI|nr:Pre-rRNA-processing protein ESF2 [Lineolata rhizophorae]
MSARKRNEWLEAGLSDEEDQDDGYDSEAAEQRRRVAFYGRTSKRRKVNSDFEGSDGDDDGVASSAQICEKEVGNLEDTARTGQRIELPDDDFVDPDPSVSHNDTGAPAAPYSKLTKKKLESARKKAARTGVVYLSRIPPFMKPTAIRNLLSPYGDIGRIFLTPEDAEMRRRRIRSGGNKKTKYTDGWVEFLDKKDAKAAVETLNTQIIGGKKGGWYHDDVWNMRYLKGFKWHHLTEQIANENAERAARMRAEVVRTTKENKEFLANVEKAKMVEGMKSKREGKTAGRNGLNNADEVEDTAKVESVKFDGPRRHFKQSKTKLKKLESEDDVDQPEDVTRVLSKIF